MPWSKGANRSPADTCRCTRRGREAASALTSEAEPKVLHTKLRKADHALEMTSPKCGELPGEGLGCELLRAAWDCPGVV